MKNISKLHLLFAMGIMFGSVSLMEAYGKSSEQSESSDSKKCNKPKQAAQSKKSKSSTECGKSDIKKIEHQIAAVIKQFKKDHDADAAYSKLDAIADKIKDSVARMKQDEQHGQMWRVHQHTLQRKLKDARAFIRKNSK